MKLLANVSIVFISLVCITALAVSVYPGALQDMAMIMIFAAVLATPVVGLAALIAVGVLAYRGKLQSVRIPWGRVGIMCVMLVVTYGLLKLYIPRRIAFEFVRTEFQELVDDAPTITNQPVPLKQNVGFYHVDLYGKDSRGGVYFRVYTVMDALSPDVTSFGFVYSPNHEGTPFGAARYSIHPLGKDWYWFRASDDWH